MSKRIPVTSFSDKNLLILLFFYIVSLLLFCSQMSPIYYSNEWADVNVYFNIGKAIFNGQTLYTDTFDHKGPLIFFIYGLGYLISNDTFIGMFLIQIILWFVMCYAIFELSKLFLDKVRAYFVTIIFTVFLVKIMKAGGSAEEFVLTFQIISLYLFLKFYKQKDLSRHNPKHMLVHGILCSMVFFIKLNLMMFWFFPLAGIFLNLLLQKEYKNFATNLLSFLLGFLIITIPICAYFYVNGALVEAYEIYIDLNRKYSGIDSVSTMIQLLFVRILYLYLEPLVLLVLPTIGVFYFPFKRIENKIGKWTFMLAGIVMYMVIFVAPYYQYYYPIAFLPFTLLGFLAVAVFMSGYAKFESYSWTYLIVLSILINYAGLSQVKSFSGARASNFLSKDSGLMTIKMHNEILKVENPTLLNLGFGLTNSLFTTCNIMPNVRYFFAPNLDHKVYPQLRNEQTRYLEEKKTDFVVLPGPALVEYRSRHVPKRDIGSYYYYIDSPALNNNYDLVLSDTILNLIDENSINTYLLYKKKK